MTLDTPLRAGAELDGYQLLELGGAGGFSFVWKATRLSDGEPVALKLPRVPELTERLRREAALLERVDAERVVPLLAARLDGDPPFLVMPWIEGRDLPTPDGPPPAESQLPALVALRELARLVAGLHEAGVVHGDLKPGNVRVDEAGGMWLLDLGLARLQIAAKQQRSLAHSLVSVSGASIAGTLDYIAPEVLAGKPPTAAADVYSLGVIAHRLLTGHPPTFGVDPRELNPYLPPGVVELLGELLHQDPEHRPRAAAALSRPLERLIAEERRCLKREGHVRRALRAARRRRLRRALRATRHVVLPLLALGAIVRWWSAATLTIAVAPLVVVALVGIGRVNLWVVALHEATHRRSAERRRRARLEPEAADDA